MFSLLLVILILSCTPYYDITPGIDVAPDTSENKSSEASEASWELENPDDGDYQIKVLVDDGFIDIAINDSVYHIQDILVRVNYKFCPLTYLASYFSTYSGHSRFGCDPGIDSRDIYLIEITIFPNDSDRYHYSCYYAHHDQPDRAIIKCHLVN